MQLVTHQTGPQGQKVRRLLVEEGADIRKEYYAAALTDRATQKVALMASSEGGMDIEEVAHRTPEKIIKVFVDPLVGLTDAQAQQFATGIGVPPASQPQAVDVLKRLYRCYMDTDASLAEINPLILEGNGHIKALDAKFNFDANALFRHPEIVAYRDLDEEDPAEIEASKFDLSYISLDGNIGCLVNGAGLAMARMGTIKLFGGEPANFGRLPRGRVAGAVGVLPETVRRRPARAHRRCRVRDRGKPVRARRAARRVRLRVPDLRRLRGLLEHRAGHGAAARVPPAAELQRALHRHVVQELLGAVAHDVVSLAAGLPLHPPRRQSRGPLAHLRQPDAHDAAGRVVPRCGVHLHRVGGAARRRAGDRARARPRAPRPGGGTRGRPGCPTLDGKVHILDADDGTTLRVLETNRPFVGSNGVEGHGGAIDGGGAFVSDGQLVGASGYAQFGQLPGNMLLVYGLKP